MNEICWLSFVRYVLQTWGLTLFDLEKKYLKCEFANDVDVVKVSIVYYTKLTMMVKDKYPSIDPYLFQAVDDMDYFNRMD